jgi:hypothetical protein
MFCSFKKAQNILDLYGKGKEMKPNSEACNDIVS